MKGRADVKQDGIERKIFTGKEKEDRGNRQRKQNAKTEVNSLQDEEGRRTKEGQDSKMKDVCVCVCVCI